MKPKDTPNPVTIKEDGSLTILLPISKEVLTVRRPKGKDLAAIEEFRFAKPEAGNIATMAYVASLLTGRSPEDLMELDAEDVSTIGEVISSNFRVFSRQ